MEALYNITEGVYETSTMNNSNNTTPYIDKPIEHITLYAIFVPLVWGIITLVAAFGNALVIYTLIRHGDKNATNYFVINLAIADFAFVIIVLPFTATLFALPAWVFGNVMCKITMYMIYVTLHATCLTLMAMTIDRYCAIVHPISSRAWRNTKVATISCLVVWTVSFVMSLPFVIVFRTMEADADGHEFCDEVWPEPKNVYKKASQIVVVSTTYVVPLAVILICYTMILKTLWRKGMASDNSHSNDRMSEQTRHQAKRRMHVTKLVALVVSVFALCWLPIHIINLWLILDEDGFPTTSTMYFLKILSHTLSYANSCINPFVYAFIGGSFRKALRKAFPFLVHRCKIFGGLNEN